MKHWIIAANDVNISIAEDASFSACGNGGYDIYAVYASSFTVAMEGDGMCVAGSTNDVDAVTIPPQCERTCPAPDRFF